MSDANEHSWFTDRIAASLAGGLTPDEQARFDAHAATCDACRRERDEMRELEGRMTTLFAPALAGPDFEDRLIARFRDRTTRRLSIAGFVERRLRLPTIPKFTAHPAVRRAAVAAAAIIVLGGFGYVGSSLMEHNRLPGMATLQANSRVRAASNLRQVGQAILLYANENKGAYPRDADSDGIADSFSFNVASQPAAPNVLAKQMREEMTNGWAFGGGGGRGGGGATSSVNWSDRNQSKNNDDVKDVRYGGGHVDFQKNPFPGVTRDLSSSNSVLTGGVQTGADALVLQPPVNEPQLKVQTAAGAKQEVVSANLGPGAQQQPKDSEAIVHSYFRASDIKGERFFDDKSGADTGKLADANGVANDRKRMVLGREVQILDGAEHERAQATPSLVAAGTPVQSTDAPQQQGQGGQQPQGAAQPAAPAPAVAPAPDQAATTPATTSAAVAQRKVIRNGEVEFEVESFDAAFVTISKIVAEESGFVATTNSEKLPNGKVKGVVVVRCPPDHLDVLVLKLRGIGELKKQNLTAQDVSKEYTDLESELRAAKAMQERLLEIIKSGKGEVKDLVAAERELGTWRTKSEKLEGQIRYYDNLVSLSTLSISMYEKDVKSAAMTTQRENVDLGLESEDVEKSRAEAIKAVDDAKGRIVESELKKFEAGQLAAKIVADVSPDSAGGVIDRLKQLGKVARLEMSRQQTTANGQPPAPGARLERGDTHLVISLYNLANIAPRQTSNLNVACDDVETAYAAILARVNDAGGRVVTSNLSRNNPQQISATIQFEVKSDQAEATLQAVRGVGEVMKLTVAENPDANNVTAAKRGFNVQLMSMSQVQPREVNQRSVAVDDVEKSYQSILSAAQGVKARVIASKLESTGNGSGQVNGYLEFVVGRDDVGAIEKAIAAVGDTYNRAVTTAAADADNASSAKVQYKLAIQNVQQLPPRSQQTLAVEVHDVDGSVAKLTTSAQSAGGRVIDSTKSREANGQTIAQVSLDVPLSQAASVIDAARDLGIVRVERSSKNEQSPDGAVARARVDVTLASPDTIVSANDGLWASVRRGLSTSAAGLLYSLQLIIIGLCFVGPWVLLVVGGWKLAKRARRKPVAAA